MNPTQQKKTANYVFCCLWNEVQKLNGTDDMADIVGIEINRAGVICFHACSVKDGKLHKKEFRHHLCEAVDNHTCTIATGLRTVTAELQRL